MTYFRKMNFKTFVLPDPHQLKTGSEDDVFSKSGKKKNRHSIKEKTPFSVLISTKNTQFIYKMFLPYGHKFVTEIFDPLSFFLKIYNSESC